MEYHAIKIEDLELNKTKADLMVETFEEILSDIGFSDERISSIECRSRDGFIAYSHNKGGVNAVCFIMNSHLRGSGYDYGDGVINKWDDYQHEMYKDDHPGKHRYLHQFWDGKRKDSDLMQRVLEHYYEYIDGDSDYDSTMFEVRFMVKPDGTVDVDVFGCTKDAPYFRSSDYNANKNFEFTGPEEFKKEVMKFLDTCDCIDLIGECY